MAIIVKPIASDTPTDSNSILKLIRDVFLDLEDQLNQNASLVVKTDGIIPAGLARDTVLIISYKGTISLYVQGAKSRTQLSAEMLGGLSKQGTQYLGHITGTIAPAVVNFPNDNDWGFYTDTTVPTTYICYNVNNILRKVVMP